MVIVAILLWIAVGLARLIDARLQRASVLSPTIRALSSNLTRIVLVSVALLIGLNVAGIDLTVFTVFSGAVGVGVGLSAIVRSRFEPRRPLPLRLSRRR